MVGGYLNAVGFDPMRNDQLEIQNVPFDSQQEIYDMPEENPFSSPAFWISNAQKVIPFLFLGILLLILRGRLKKVK